MSQQKDIDFKVFFYKVSQLCSTHSPRRFSYKMEACEHHLINSLIHKAFFQLNLRISDCQIIATIAQLHFSVSAVQYFILNDPCIPPTLPASCYSPIIILSLCLSLRRVNLHQPSIKVTNENS